MLIRAFIVLLVILNVGTGLWWLSQSAPASVPVPVAVSAGVARLELMPGATPAPEIAPASAPTAPAATPKVEPPAPAAPPAPRAPEPETVPAPVAAAAASAAAPEQAKNTPQCASFGPFADRAAAQNAITSLGPAIARPRVRELTHVGGGSYRVMVPAQVSREEAQALVKRIAAAGISDYFIIASGEEANAVALGQYRNKDGAERRLAQVQAAGFGAVLIPSSASATPTYWVDVAINDGGDRRQLAANVHANQSQSLDCAGLR